METIQNYIKTNEKRFIDELIDLLKTLKPELLLTLGAGDIDQFVKPIEESL